MVYSPLAYISCGVAVIEYCPRHKYVTDRAVGVGTVALLQNYYCVPHVAVNEVNMEVGVNHFLNPESLH